MKHVPVRTCLGCRQRRPKRDLARLVRRDEGIVVLDASGVEPGRGAYVCRGPACLERALKAGRLSHAFRASCRLEDELERMVREAGIETMTLVHRR